MSRPVDTITEALLTQVKLSPFRNIRLKLSKVNSNVQPQSGLQNPNAKPPLIQVLAHCRLRLQVQHCLWNVSTDSLTSETIYTSSRAHQTMHIPTSPNSAGISPAEVIRRLHANLERCLQPFWSTVYKIRIIRLYLFACPPSSASTPNPSTSQSDKYSFDPENVS